MQRCSSQVAWQRPAAAQRVESSHTLWRHAVDEVAASKERQESAMPHLQLEVVQGWLEQEDVDRANITGGNLAAAIDSE